MQSNKYLRDQFIEPQLPPTSNRSIIGWIRTNLIYSWSSFCMTTISCVALIYFVPILIDWLFYSAVWSGENRTACLTVDQGGQLPSGWSGACWAYVGDRFTQFMFGSYPRDELWRVLLIIILCIALLVPFLMPNVRYKRLNTFLLVIALPVFAYFILVGGVFGLPYVETSLWGGLMVTLIISFVGIVTSLPLGILLALGRRSNMPVLKTLCVTFIEVVRGVPLITVLFMASVLLPLFMEPGNNIDKFLRALIGVSIFASAYMAENIRGGLQAIPKGQYEAADALGLNYLQKMTFVVIPQAIKMVIPSIVNTFIGMFKDTSLIMIISMYDLLGIVKSSFGDAKWVTPVTPLTGLVFAGFIFWIFCFMMSRYSIFMERRLDTGHKK
ncbi:amino acid ABC transporter permease [Brucella intermedia]|uniref:amino acid ABC transporter permease n=1 Tax=Brucella intermedia TaxID=94625 RepID=UPI002248F20F|nr:amino acid ABC transporter permease [Brucella intermedia]